MINKEIKIKLYGISMNSIKLVIKKIIITKVYI